MAQQRRPQWDCIHTGQARAGQLGSMALYRPWTEDESRTSTKSTRPSDTSSVGKVHTPYGLCVNTKQITTPDHVLVGTMGSGLQGQGRLSRLELGRATRCSTPSMSRSGGTSENIDPGIAKVKELFTKNEVQDHQQR